MARTALNLPLLVFVISLLLFNPMLATPIVKPGNILPDFAEFAQPVKKWRCKYFVWCVCAKCAGFASDTAALRKRWVCVKQG